MTGPQRHPPPGTFPVRPRPTYRCLTCGAPARLYPGGAWCDLHSPNQSIREAARAARQPDTVAGPGSGEVRAA